MTCERKCIKLDLHIDEEEELRQGNHEHADEVLCLRILSTKTKYRFGGLKIHVRSPVFDVAKIFNVEFDEESEVSLIRGQGSMVQPCGSRRSSIQLKKFVTKKINSTWHSAVRVKRFFADSIWN